MDDSDHDVAVAARALGRVHRPVGLALDDVRGQLGLGEHGRADRRRHGRALLGREVADDLDRDPGDVLGLGAVGGGQQRGELVPAQPRQQIACAQARAQPLGQPASTASPAPWPCWSLTALKPSRSIISIAPCTP